MDAYTLVEKDTRRSMDAMLKTWKEAVPGSMDPRPVFPPEIVRPIENALIKYRTAVLQSRGQMQAQQMYRNTPTPPQFNGHYMPPPVQAQSQQAYGLGQQPTPQHAMQSTFAPPTPQQYQQQHQAYQQSQDVEMLKRDIDALIQAFKAQFAASPHDRDLQQKLQSLLALQTYVNSNGAVIDGQQAQQIRNTISGLAAALQTQRPTPQPVAPTPSWQPPTPATQPYQPPQAAMPYLHPPQPQPQMQPSAPFLAPGALSGLQALLSNGHKPSTAQMRTAVPALQNASHTQLSTVQNNVNAAPSTNPSDLLVALAKSGIIANPPAPSNVQPTPTAPPPASTADLLRSLQGLLPPTPQIGTPTIPTAQLQPSNATTAKPRIPLTASSLKTFRPELVRSLYDAQPNQCSTCGRRFLTTDAGRAKKSRHLDWHFRTNRRIADPNVNRGSHRNWFGEEIEWIRSVEFDVSTASAEEIGAAADSASGKGGEGAASVKQKAAQASFVRAPAGVTQTTCSICYEDLKSGYNEEVQDWVFMNATMLNGRTVHATCAEEMRKAATPLGGGGGGGSLAAALQALGGQGQTQRQRSATPDSALGKRKAGDALAGTGARMKME